MPQSRTPTAPVAPHAHASHEHAHAHSAPKATRPPLAARLFAASAASRVLIAIFPLALVWLLTWWALR